jgi:hypothetical protein
MKNLRNLFALFILFTLTVTLYSCDSDVTIDDPQSEKIEDLSKTGDEINEVDDDED